MPRKLIDLRGQRFGKLTVLELAEKKNGKTMWLCRCDCENTTVVHASSLVSGNTRSCGCLTHDIIEPGTRFGKLTVIAPDHIVKGRGYAYRCKCDCGNEIVTRVGNLRNGSTRSCGCLHDELFESYKPDNYKKIFVEDTSLIKIKGRILQRNSTSGVRGVSWHKRIKKWQARICFQKKLYHLGYFDKLEDAAEARRIAEEKLFNNFLEWYEKEKNNGIDNT